MAKRIRARWMAGLSAIGILLIVGWLGREALSPEPRGMEGASGETAKPAAAEVAPLEVGTASSGREARAGADEDAPAPAMATLVLVVVREEDEKPVVGAHVSLYPDPMVEGASILAAGPTDERGRITFELAAGRKLSATAHHEGRHGSTSIDGLATGEVRTERISILQISEVTFWCRVVRDEDAAPQAFVGVELVWRESEDGLTREAHTTDAQGLVRVEILEWLDGALLVELPGFAQAAAPIVRGHETPEKAFELRLFRAARLNVLVHDPAGAPRPGLTVRAEAPAYELSQSDFWFEDAQHVRTVFDATSDATGHAILEGLPAQVELELSVLAADTTWMRERAKLRLAHGEERAVTLVVGGLAVLAGSAIDQAGLPVADQELWMSAPDPSMGMFFRTWTQPIAHVRTDAQGRFEFQDVAEGEWWVGPAGDTQFPSAESALATYGQRVVIPPGAGRAEVVLRIWRGLYLRGHVQLSSGEPVPGCPVSAHAGDEEHTGYLNATSDEQGRFSVGPVCGVEYELNAGGAFQGEYARSPTLHVRGGSEGLVLTVERAASLRGIAIDPDTGEACDGEICLTQAQVREGFAYFLMTQTKARAFQVDGISPGVWDVCMRTRNGRLAVTRITLASGEHKEIELRVGPSVPLLFTNAGTETCHVTVECEGLAVARDQVLPGQEQRFLVPPGRTSMRIVDAEGREVARRTIEIASGAEGKLRHPEGQ